MKIVVIGGTGLTGAKVVARLTEHGHNAIAASPTTGVNALTGEGLAAALTGADVVVDASNSPSYEAAAVLDFFETSTRNLLAAEKEAGVAHHVLVSVVGLEAVPENGAFRAKLAQENLVKASGIPYSIVRATQYFEFVKSIAGMGTNGDTVTLAPARIRPIAADDVARAVGRTAAGTPLNSTLEVAGPEEFTVDALVRHTLEVRKDPRKVVTDPAAKYFGATLTGDELVPAGASTLTESTFDDWLATLPPVVAQA